MTAVSTGGFESAFARVGLCVAGTVALSFSFQHVLHMVFLLRLLSGAEVKDAAAALQASLLCCIAVVSALAVLLGFVAFLPWFWRAHRNVERLGIQPASSRHWVVTGFLVPGANLLQPYYVALEIWQQSDRVRMAHSDPDESPRSSGIVTAWWICLVSSAVGILAVFVVRGAVETTVVLLSVKAVQVVLGLVGATAAVLGILMIGRIDGLQEDAQAAVTHPWTGAPA